MLTQETYNATLQNQTNKTVKTLAGITLVESIPLVVASLYGMNLKGIPQWSVLGLSAFWTATAFSLLAMLPLYWIARHRDWI